MSTLRFDYWMEISFSESVKECHYTFKCLPRDTHMQKITELNVEVIPYHEYRSGEDSFGNLTIYDDLYLEHDRFGFRISGIAKTGLAPGIMEKGDPGIYRCPHGLNVPGEGIRAYYRQIMDSMGKTCDTVYKTAVYLMNCLHGDFVYQQGVTNISTTAEQAWSLKKGVCQDYAHILIALCHLAGIPARYVTGMMVGEGFSHAWVEILSGGTWYGLDPTNGCLVGEDYIKIGSGRDADDCTINRGWMIGGGVQTQSVVVRVEEIKE